MLTPAMRAMADLPLPLLVTGVLADDEHRAVAADDLALLAHRLDRRSYLHDAFRSVIRDVALAAARLPLPVEDARTRTGRTRRASTIAVVRSRRTRATGSARAARRP